MKSILATLITLSFISFSGCSNNKDAKNTQITNIPDKVKKQLTTNKLKNKKFDPCDCNQRSQKIMDKTMALRLKFNSINELKADKKSKELVRKFATEYMELTKKCFEVNNSRLMVQSDCNNLYKLEMKQDSLKALGIHIHQGATIRL